MQMVQKIMRILCRQHAAVMGMCTPAMHRKPLLVPPILWRHFTHLQHLLAFCKRPVGFEVGWLQSHDHVLTVNEACADWHPAQQALPVPLIVAPVDFDLVWRMAQNAQVANPPAIQSPAQARH